MSVAIFFSVNALCALLHSTYEAFGPEGGDLGRTSLYGQEKLPKCCFLFLHLACGLMVFCTALLLGAKKWWHWKFLLQLPSFSASLHNTVKRGILSKSCLGVRPFVQQQQRRRPPSVSPVGASRVIRSYFSVSASLTSGPVSCVAQRHQILSQGRFFSKEAGMWDMQTDERRGNTSYSLPRREN